MPYKLIDTITLNPNTLKDEALTIFKDSAANESKDKSKKPRLRLKTLATHSGKEINLRVYPGTFVKDGAKSFYQPFEKAFLKNHNRDLDAIGRIVDARYQATLSGKRWEKDYLDVTEDGSGFIETTSEITDEDAIEKFLDGRFMTVSQGGSSDHRYCNICTKASGDFVDLWGTYKDKQGNENECDHYPGRFYDSQKALLVTGPIEYDHLSQVNSPADDRGVHTMMEMINDAKMSITEMADYLTIFKDHKPQTIKSDANFIIVDSVGQPIESLYTHDHVSTKTQVEMNGVNVEDDSKEGGAAEANDQEESTLDDNSEMNDSAANALSDSEFANLHVLKHLSEFGYIKLSDTETEQVNAMDVEDLTDEQKTIQKGGFYLGNGISFNMYDEAHLEASIAIAYSDRFVNAEDGKKFLDSVKNQAETEQIFLNDNSKGPEMEKQLKELTEKLADSESKVANLEAEIKSKSEAFDKLNEEIKMGKIEDLITLREELKSYDALELDDESRKALSAKYADKSPETIDSMIQDATEELKARADAQKIADEKAIADKAEADKLADNDMKDNSEEENPLDDEANKDTLEDSQDADSETGESDFNKPSFQI